MSNDVIGRLIQVPSGALEPVLEYDVQRDVIWTESGRWNIQDLVVVTAPVTSNPTALETWMDGPDFRVHPRANYENVVTRCGSQSAGDFEAARRCKCEHCYRAVITDLTNHTTVKDKHWRDNDACRCALNGCPCAQ